MITSEHATASPYVTMFENQMRHYFGQDVVAVNSGTSALFLTLKQCWQYEKVVLPVLTFIATVNAVSWVEQFEFWDVDIETWCINPDYTNYYNDCIVLPVDLYGVISEVNWPNYWVIKDCCESFGIVQSESDFYCYSFNGNKILTTGAGGLVVGENLDRIKILANVGRNKKGEFVEAGFNMRMAGINAKLGLQEFEHLGKRLTWQKRVNEIYRNGLPFKFQEAGPDGSTWWYTACLLPNEIDVVQMVNILNSLNIDYGIKPARRIFRPLNQEVPYKDGKHYPNAELIYNRGICLPQPKNEKDLMKVCLRIKRSL